MNCLVETRDGTMWCGTEGGLFHLEERNGRWASSRVDLGIDGAVNALAIGQWGEVFVGTHGQVQCIRPDASVATYELPGIGGVSRIKSVYEDAGGTVWVGMQFDIYRSSPRASVDLPLVFADVGTGAPTGWGNAFFETRDRTLWIASTTGLWRLNNAGTGTFERRAALDVACDRDVWDVAEDRDGNLWLATSCGVLRLDRYGFTGFAKSDGLTSAFINSIFESNLGELIVTTNQSERRIQRFDGATFTSVSPQNLPISYPGWGWGQTVMQDHTGAWWVPIGLGVYRYPAADRPDAVLRHRRYAIALVVLLAWAYSRAMVASEVLADIGALSFSALRFHSTKCSQRLVIDP